MTNRTSIVKIQNLTKSEYALTKHIPNAEPTKPIPPESDNASDPIDPTPKLVTKHPQAVTIDLNQGGERVKRAGQRPGPSDQEEILSGQLSQCNQRVEAQNMEIEKLRFEVRRLQEERAQIAKQYEQKIAILLEQGNSQIDYERRVQMTENENLSLREEIDRLKYEKMAISKQLENLKAQFENNDNSNATIESLIAERDYYQNQLRQAKTIQINLEQELRQRADERTKMISEYELRIANLQNDITILKSQSDGDNLRKSTFTNKLQGENSQLLQDLKNLRNINTDLQSQIDKLRSDKLNFGDNTRQKLIEAEIANNSNLALLEEMKMRSENSDVDKILLMIEVDRLREQIATTENVRNYDFSPEREEPREVIKRAGVNVTPNNNAEIIKEKAALETMVGSLTEKVKDLEIKNILFMLEIERLGSIVMELQSENELWRNQVIEIEENSNKQIAEFKRQYEQVIRPQIEGEIKSATDRLESDKNSLEVQNRGNLLRIEDLENRIANLQGEIARLQQKNLDLTRELDEWKFKYGQLERGSESMKYSLEGDLRSKFEREKNEMLTKWNQERTKCEDDINRYKQRLSELESKTILLSSENEHLLAVIKDKEREIEELRKRLVEADQEQRRQFDQLREQLEITFKQRIDIQVQTRVSQIEAEKDGLERELKKVQSKAEYLEGQIAGLNDEIQRLRQENAQKALKLEEFNAKMLLLADRDREIQAWKDRYNQLQENQAQELERLRQHYEEMFNSRLNAEMMEAQTRLSNEKALLEGKLRDTMQQLDNLENKISILSSEVNRLQALANKSAEEKDEWKRKAQDLQRELERIKPAVELQIRETIERELMEINAKFARERGELEGNMHKLKATIQELEVKTVLGMIEIERLHSVIFEHEKGDEMWRERMVDLEAEHANDIEDLKSQFEKVLRDRLNQELQQAGQQWQEEKMRLEAELSFLKNQNKDLQDMYNQANEEIKKLRNQLNGKDNELEQLRQKINQLHIEQDRYGNELTINIQTQMRSEFEIQMRDLTGKFNNERIAFEDQIRQLKIRLAEMEHELREAQEQNEALTSHVEERHVEIETVKREHQELAKRSAANMSDLNERMERQKRADIDEAVRMSASQFQVERMGLEDQLRALQQKNQQLEDQLRALQQKNQQYQDNLIMVSMELERMTQANIDLKKEFENLKARLAGVERKSQVELDQMRMQLEAQARAERENLLRELHARFSAEMENYETQIRELKQRLIEYENNMNLANGEIKRLGAVIADKNNEIEVWKGKIGSIERVKQQEIQELKQRLEFEQRAIVERELRNLADQYNVERTQYEAKIKDLKQKLIEYENKFTYLSVENDRLGALYDDKVKEVEAWKQRYANLEKSNYAEIEEVRIQFESLRRNSMQMSDYEVRFQAERTAFETKILQYKHKVGELEAIIADITKENQRLNGLYFEKNAEAEKLKKRGGQGDISAEEFDKLLKENQNLKKSLMENNEIKVRVEVERTNCLSQIAQLKQIIEANQIEMSKLSDLLGSRKAENENLYRELNTIREEAARKLKNYKEIEAEYLMLVNRTKNVNQEIGDLQNARDTYRAQLEKNEVELSQKNKELLEKIQQVDLLKARYEEAIANVNPISSTIITRFSTTTREKEQYQ